MRFSGQSALVIGGTSGIGWGVAEAFAAEGAEVLVTGLTEAEVGTAAAKVGGRAIRAAALDVTNAAGVARFAGELTRVDALVNCAGIIRRREEYDLAVFEQLLAVNLTGTMRTCEAVRGLLAKHGGAIVNIGSMYSFFGAAHAPGYGASKGGVIQLTKSLAREYASQNIRVNAIAPGWIRTAITEPLFNDPVRSRPIVERTPLGRWGEPTDIAGPVLFLCSSAAAFVTGAVLPIDGGYLLTGVNGMPRFCANLSMMFNEVAFLERFREASRHRFTAVEFLLPYAHEKERLAELARESGVRVVLFNMPSGNWEAGDRGLACDPRRVGEFQDGVGLAVEYALGLGTRQIHCMAGLKPNGVNDEAMRRAYLENLRFAGNELAKHDLRLLIEAINPRDVPGYFLTSSRQAFDLLQDAGVANAYFQFDAYHLQIVEGDLSTTLEKHLTKIAHVQIADTPGRNEPGTGEINYPFLFGHLDRIGYEGFVGCEYRPATTTSAGLGWLEPYL